MAKSKPNAELITRLRAYQDWRRGGDGEQPDPVQLGKDLEEAIELLEGVKKSFA